MDKTQPCTAPLYGGQQILAVAQVHRTGNDWAIRQHCNVVQGLSGIFDVSDMQDTGQVRAAICVGWSTQTWQSCKRLSAVCSLTRGAFVPCWHYCCGWYHLAQTPPGAVLIAGPKLCQCFTLPPGRMRVQGGCPQLSAAARRHPCISLALVMFVPSQWAVSETALPIRRDFHMAPRAVCLAMRRWRMRGARGEKGLDLAPRKRAIARPP